MNGNDGLRRLARRLQVTPVGVVAFSLIALGLVLGFTVHIGLLALFAAGAFGPGLLRELGLLADADEFQREAALKAGYRAFLITGALLVLAIVVKSWGVLSLDQDQVPGSLVLLLLLVVYLMSYLFSYWGARAAAFRILLTFGLFWLVFVGLSHATEPMALLMEGLVVCLPFFALAFASRRWPRASGALLVLAAVAAFFFFNLDRALEGNSGSGAVLLLLFLPLLGTGIALLRARAGHPAEAP